MMCISWETSLTTLPAESFLSALPPAKTMKYTTHPLSLGAGKYDFADPESQYVVVNCGLDDHIGVFGIL